MSLAFVLAAATPLTIAGTLLAITGPTTVASMFALLGAALALSAAGLCAISRWTPDPCTRYTRIGQQLGRPAGISAAWTALLAYTTVLTCLYGLLGATGRPLLRHWLGWAPPWWFIALGAWAVTSLLSLLTARANAITLTGLLITAAAPLTPPGLALVGPALTAKTLLVAVLLAGTVAFHNSSARHLYALARARLLPACLGSFSTRTLAPRDTSLLQTSTTFVVLAGAALSDTEPTAQLLHPVGAVAALGVLLITTATLAAAVPAANPTVVRHRATAYQPRHQRPPQPARTRPGGSTHPRRPRPAARPAVAWSLPR